MFLLLLQMFSLQELCLDCTGANAHYFEVCDLEGVYKQIVIGFEVSLC